MSWPWTTIGLPEDATPTEIRTAFDAWKQLLAEGKVAGSARDSFEIERAFEVALEMAEQRDPSHLHHSQFPDAWRKPDATPSNAPIALNPEHPPLPSADVLATSLLGLIKQSADFSDLTAALARIRGWQDSDARNGADRFLREWLVDGGELTPIQVVRLARIFDWQPSSPTLQSPERDLDWRRVVKAAYDIIAPPDPAYTGAIGRGFLMVAAVAGIGLAALLLPRIMGGGGLRILIPVVFAAACVWLLIRWRR